MESFSSSYSIGKSNGFGNVGMGAEAHAFFLFKRVYRSGVYNNGDVPETLVALYMA
jgi:hypothetical protein